MTDGPDIPPEIDLSGTVHTLPTAEVFHLVATRPGGLTDSEAGKNLRRFGKNRIQKIKGKPLYLRFLANFTHLMAILLWIGGLIAFIARMPPLGVAIWMVNLINGIFSFWQEFRAEKAAEALMKLLPHHVRVIRDNKEQEILAEDIVPGDVMLLAEGDHISADARLVEETELRLDQSTLTGESRPVRKTCEAFLLSDQSRIDIPNLVFAGTNVVSGTGSAVVYATGMETEFGRIAHLTQTLEDEPSPLQNEMIHVTRMVTLVAVGVGALFFLLLLLLTEVTLAESFIFAVGMIVAFVPEGLLPTVTLALAKGSQRMARRNALIKRLSAVETLGCTSVICTDKTGTLTQNEMTVSKIWVARQRFTVTGVGYAPDGVIIPEGEGIQAGSRTDMRQLLIAAGLCNNARLIAPQGESFPWMILGDPTEASLKVAALKGGVDTEAEAQKAPRLRELPFESGRKMMSSIHQTDHSRVAYLKGAPKVILSLCTSIRRDQQDCPLTEDLINEIIVVNDEYAASGLRVLAIALRTIPDTLSDYRPDTVERDLTFLGLVAMMDPPRTEVAEAVMKCHSASIRIIMITGDYGLTAESIARRIGIITGEKTRIITGPDLDTMSDADLHEAFLGEVIFARVAPEQKLRVVTVLKEMGHVVAVTGDGVNDAPALKKADIGIAMGIAGTDVAKEAADMVLTDDNFASIVNAVEEGRAVYANIKKFSSYIFTSNAPEAVPFICFAFSWARIPLALNVMQILSIDLGTDMVPALALGTERPEPGVMKKPPRDLKEHVITIPLLIKSYLWLGSIQSLAVMMAFFLMFWTNGYWGQFLDLPSRGTLYQSATAMALAAVVTTQIGNVLAQRTEHRSIFEIGLLTNRLIVIGIVTELVLILMIVYIPFFQRVFGTAAFPPVYWLFLFALVPLLLIAEELRKGISRWMEQKKTKRTHAGDVT